MAAPTDPQAWRSARLHVVTGKGGTGKSTVAAALALALADAGRRVLLAEVERRQSLAPLLGCAPLDDRERLVRAGATGGELHAVAVDAHQSLREYLATHYRLGAAGAVLDQVGAVELATSIAPGLGDVLLMGKVYDVARRTPAHQRPRGAPDHYDAVVLDAPPTGRVVRFLDASGQVADLARVGPIRQQADAVSALVHSAQTAVHLVTLLEEMPVTETVEAVAELRREGLNPGLLVVDRVRDDGMTEDDLAGFDAAVAGEVTEADVAAELAAAGVPGPALLAGGLLERARVHASRLQVEGEQQEVLDRLGLPTVLLPQLVAGVTPQSLPELAALLTDQVGGLA
ncbi:ArsA family ATPase [Arsenicicoccus dermatophilus]|uniref:ArsA family ATPase n=1 Tax=Arsenicicoccus dermatophilus TaxID=1076331 RepID=UPI00391742FA